MSSTALVTRQLADQGELTTRHGRDVQHHMEDRVKPFRDALSAFDLRHAAHAGGDGLEHGIGAILIRYRDRLAQKLSRSPALGQPPQAEEGEVAERAQSLHDHVIICGADEAGELLSQTLRLAGVPHFIAGIGPPEGRKCTRKRCPGLPVVVSCRQLQDAGTLRR
jgi:hypothetical protein